MSEEQTLLLAQTPAGKAFREHKLRNLLTLLEAKTDWGSAEQRVADFAGFHEMAKNLRASDASIPDLQPQAYKVAASVVFQAEYASMLEKIQAHLDSAGIAYQAYFYTPQSRIVAYQHQDSEEKTHILLVLAAQYKGEDTWEDVLETAVKWDRVCFRHLGSWTLVADCEKNGVLMQFDDTPEGYTQARKFCVRMSELDVDSTSSVEQLEEDWQKVLDTDDQEWEKE